MDREGLLPHPGARPGWNTQTDSAILRERCKSKSPSNITNISIIIVVFDLFENYAHYVLNRLWYMYILVVNLYKAVYTFRDSLNTRRYWTTLLQLLTPSWILLHPTSLVWPVQTSGRNWKLYPPSKPCWNLVRICLIYKFHIQITKSLKMKLI